MKIPPLLCFILILLSAFSCTRRKQIADEILPPSSPPLSRSVIGYGVINTSYSHVFDKRGVDGVTLGLLRKGAIVEVIERRPIVVGEKAESWVFASGVYSGWLREDDVRIFESLAQAETAAVSLRK